MRKKTVRCALEISLIGLVALKIGTPTRRDSKPSVRTDGMSRSIATKIDVILDDYPSGSRNSPARAIMR